MRYGIVTKIFHFESAHHLPGHRGKCARLHGHSYRLEVTIRGPIKDMPGASDHGMVMDFDDLSGTVKNSVIERLDHRDLNEVTELHTTAENLVHWIWSELIESWSFSGAYFIVFGSGKPKVAMSKSPRRSVTK